MATEKYTSNIKTINYDQETVYNKLSNLENLKPLISKENLEQLKDKVPNAPDVKIDDFEASADECSFTISPLGRTGMKIIDREPSKTIKLTGNGTVPFQFFFWIQLLPVNGDACKMKLTLHAELNPMIKMMVNKHLKEGIDRLADTIAMIPFRTEQTV